MVDLLLVHYIRLMPIQVAFRGGRVVISAAWPTFTHSSLGVSFHSPLVKRLTLFGWEIFVTCFLLLLANGDGNTDGV